MWRYIVVNNAGNYVFDMKRPDRPMIIVRQEDADKIAREWGREFPRSGVRVRRISTRSAAYAAILDAPNPNPSPRLSGIPRRRRGPQVFRLAKGLSKETAFARAKKKATRDFRGFTYDPKTGVAKLI